MGGARVSIFILKSSSKLSTEAGEKKTKTDIDAKVFDPRSLIRERNKQIFLAGYLIRKRIGTNNRVGQTFDIFLVAGKRPIL